jgi:two-component system, NtrC family, response regulator AtoC
MTQNRNILIVDSDPLTRRELSRELESIGYAVSSAQEGHQAWEKIKTSEFRLVIAAYETPELMAIEFCNQVISDFPETRLLYLSHRASVKDAVAVMKAGAFDFVMKPVANEQLHAMVHRAFGEPLGGPSGRRRHEEGRKIVTRDKGMQKLLDLARQVADSRASILIHGESGTGKELLARFIHENSGRRQGPFVAVNCGALPESLLESELFGHEKGAFTGAISQKSGKFELADGGTLLLDEITEMQISLQVKLLRVLQEREIDRLGGRAPIPIDIRVIATTNRDINAAIQEKTFREDLYFRLNVIPFRIPPLRERRVDIPILARYFVDKYNTIDGRHVKSLATAAVERLSTLSFSGNVRELENIIERAVLLSDGECIQEKDLFIDTGQSNDSGTLYPEQRIDEPLSPRPLWEVEKNMIFQALDETNGNRTHAAHMLGISVRTLRNKLNEYKETAAIE